MPSTCCVVGCKNRHSAKSDKRFFVFPAIIKHHNDEQTRKLSTERRNRWISRMKRKNWMPNYATRICSDHFINGKPSALYDRNNPDWAPTQNLGLNTKRSEAPAKLLARYERQKAREKRRISVLESISKMPVARPALPEVIISDHEPPNEEDRIADLNHRIHGQDKEIGKNHGNIEVDVACQTDNTWLSAMELELKQLRLDNQYLRKQCHEQHEEISALSITEESFMKDEEKLMFYTGLTVGSFKLILDLVGKLVPTTAKLTTFQRLLMFLMKVKLDLHFNDIAYRFNVALSTVTRNFHKVLKVMKNEPEAVKLLPQLDAVCVRKPGGSSNCNKAQEVDQTL